MNDNDRAQWIDNDEYLYNLWRHSRLSKREYIRQYRQELTEYINKVLNMEPAK